MKCGPGRVRIPPRDLKVGVGAWQFSRRPNAIVAAGAVIAVPAFDGNSDPSHLGGAQNSLCAVWDVELLVRRVEVGPNGAG